MTAFLRNALLAAAAVSSLAGSAMADNIPSCGNNLTNDWWSGRCCSAGDANCLGRESHGRDHHDNGGRDPNGGGATAGAK